MKFKYIHELSVEEQAKDIVNDCLYNGTTREGAYSALYLEFIGEDLDVALKVAEGIIGYSEEELNEIEELIEFPELED